MTPIPAMVVTVHTATVMAIMKPIERPASRFSTKMPMMLTTTAMIATRSEIQIRSDHSMPAGSTDALSARGLMLYLPRAPPGQSRCLRLVTVADTPHGHDAPGLVGSGSASRAAAAHGR